MINSERKSVENQTKQSKHSLQEKKTVVPEAYFKNTYDYEKKKSELLMMTLTP